MIARQPGAVIGGTNATYGLGGMPATTREAGIPVDPSIYDDRDEKFDNEVCIRIPYPCIVVTLRIFFSMCLFSVEKKTPVFALVPAHICPYSVLLSKMKTNRWRQTC